MIRCNPILTESLSALAVDSPGWPARLRQLTLQALVLVLFWPKHGLMQLVARGEEPRTLLALVITLGLGLCYLAIRDGTEELLGERQVSLREWALATPLSVPRIVSGYVQAQLLQSLHAVALCAPLLVVAHVVSASYWSAVVWCLLAAMLQALLYRLLAASLHLGLGHRAELVFYSSRAVLVLGQALTLACACSLSHPLLAHALLGGDDASLVASVPGLFLLVYGSSVMLMCLVVGLQLRPYRSRADGADVQPPHR
ncbi:MAG: hypothetical protein KDK91_01070 [Gammaproteobacteria bacterium]|nr:hypothetical protein [Gammaproteobacteria bacterium]